MDRISTPKKIYAVYTAFAGDIANMDKDENGLVSVTFAQNYWEKVDGQFETIEFEDSPRQNPAGTQYGQSVKIVFANDDATARQVFNQLIEKPLVLCLAYSDGSFQVVGNIDSPLWLSFNHNAKGFTNKRELTFTRAGLEEAVYMQQSVIS